MVGSHFPGQAYPAQGYAGDSSAVVYVFGNVLVATLRDDNARLTVTGDDPGYTLINNDPSCTLECND
jgi:hypothetical protein